MTYAPGFYAARLPRDGNFSRCLALARRHGDYEPGEKTWHIAVAVPGAASAGVLEELAGLGAVITECADQEEPS